MRTLVVALAILLVFSFSAGAQEANPTLVDQAKREGRVVWYTTIAVPEGQEFIKLFEQRYPFIKVDMVRTGAGPMVNRILSEDNAGRHAVDVIHGVSSRGVLPHFEEKGIITSYDSPERRFIADDLKDKNGFWVSLYALPYVVIFNKRLVKADDVPKVYEDLLSPKWKGKKILNDTENYAWFDGLLNHWGKEKGIAFFRKLAQQEQGFQRGARLRVQLVTAAEYHMTIGFAPHAQDYKFLNAIYEIYISRFIPRVPYPSTESMKTVLAQLGEKDPRARGARPEQFLDSTFLQEMEREGFIQQLWK